MSDTNNSNWKPPREKPAFEKILLIVFAGGTGLMAFFAMLGLIPENGFPAYAKAALIGFIAGIVSYAVNRFAIEKGAPLAATGYILAGIASVGSIVIVGFGLFASTYAGLTINSVRELQLQEYGQAKTLYIGQRGQNAAQALRTSAVIKIISGDLRATAACEVKNSCISGRGKGGRGSVGRKLEAIASRADEIARQLEQGQKNRIKILRRLNRLIGAYQAKLGDTNTSLAERRRKLLLIDAQIDQHLSTLDEAVPVALLRAYAQELQTGVTIVGRTVATTNVNALLQKHGRSLSSVLSTLSEKTIIPPVFPAQAGVSATFSYMAHFLPIAAITGVVELILPFAMWIYVFVGIVWDKEQNSPRPPHPRDPNSPKGGSPEPRKRGRPRLNGDAREGDHA